MGDKEEGWEEDACAGHCRACREDFTIINRRHHCRLCGQLYCNGCSNQRAFVPSSGEKAATRVCDACFSICAAQSLASSEEAEVRLHAARQLLDAIEENHLLPVRLRAVDALLAVQKGCTTAGVSVALLEGFRLLAQEGDGAVALGGKEPAMALVRAILLQAAQEGHEQMLLLSAELHLLLSSVDGVRKELVGAAGMAYLLDLVSTARGALPLQAQDLLLETVVNLALDPWCAAEVYDHAKGVRMLLDQARSPCQSSLRVTALMALLNIADLGTTARSHMVEEGALPVLLSRIQDQDGGPSRRFAAEVLHALVVDEDIAVEVMQQEPRVVAGLSSVLFSNQALKTKSVRLLCGLIGRLGSVESTRADAEVSLSSALCTALEQDSSTTSCMHIARCIHAVKHPWMMCTIKGTAKAEELLRDAAAARQQEVGKETKNLLDSSVHQTELDTGWVLLPKKKE